MRIVFKVGVIGWELSGEHAARSFQGVVPHRWGDCEYAGGNPLATAYSSRTMTAQKMKLGEIPHDEPARDLSRPGLQHGQAFRKQDARRHGGKAVRFQRRTRAGCGRDGVHDALAGREMGPSLS